MATGQNLYLAFGIMMMIMISHKHGAGHRNFYEDMLYTHVQTV